MARPLCLRLLWRRMRRNAQSLRQSCSHETSAGRFGSCETRLVGTASHPPSRVSCHPERRRRSCRSRRIPRGAGGCGRNLR
ncbi:hypothetical protein C1861_03400 [Eggerthella lenta]|nr:hypothetical protein C1861_03400 [Eggerthella lenta]